MERTLEDIKYDLDNAKEELDIIFKIYNKIHKRVVKLQDELDTYKIYNGLYHSMSDLKKYIGREISSIKLVERENNGTLTIEEIVNDEFFSVDENGHLDFSSYQSGVMRYDEDLEKYVEWYHFSREEHDYIGFLEIEFEDEDEDEEWD